MHDVLKFQNSQCSISKIHHISYIFLIWIWILTKLPFLDISCFFLIWVWIWIVSKLSFQDISCIFFIWIRVVTKLHFQRKIKGTHCCVLFAAMHHTTQPGTIPNLGWLAKYLSFAKYSSMQGLVIWQLHNCQLRSFWWFGPWNGPGWNQPRKHTSINRWMEVDRKYFSIGFEFIRG